MRHKNSRKTVAKKRRAGGTCPLFGMDRNMFGDLDYYEDEQYGLSHSTICFDSLYEKREYINTNIARRFTL